MNDRPPENLDCENFVIGPGAPGAVKGYDHLKVAIPVYDGREFRFDPGRMPILSMVLGPCLVIVFLGGWLWICHRLGGGPDAFTYIAISFLGAINCAVFGVYPYFRFRHERKRGSWLIYDLATRRVRLPRDGQEFALHEIVYLQYMTTKRLRRHRESDDDARLTELNLVTCKDGERARWPLLASSKHSGDPFAYLIRPLLRHTKIPVVRFKNPRNGWDVAIEPFTAESFDDD